MRAMVAILAFLLATAAHAERLCGSARVIDGDTVEIRDTVARLRGIDAPEAETADGQRATTALRERVGGDALCAVGDKRGAYGRLITRVYHDGTELSAWLVAQGHAVRFDRYSDDPALALLEDRARQAGAGQWR